MTNTYDVAVIGAGAMGSAATFYLSKTGKKILVLDQFVPPHTNGSSHGESRIIREAYFENPAYVPLVQQAYILWKELEDQSVNKLFLKTGGLMIGHKDQRLFKGTALSATLHGISCDFLDESKINEQFPIFQTNPETVALFEKKAGILYPEACIRTQLMLSNKRNVDFHFNESVLQVKGNKNFVAINTSHSTYKAHKVIVSNGAWITSLLPELNLPLEVKRQVLFWFSCPDENVKEFMREKFPIFICEYAPGKMMYGFPDIGSGIKVAIHHQGQHTTARTINRNVSESEKEEITSLVNKCFNVKLSYHHSVVCMYTNTPDEHFIIDYHPDHRNIILVSACSGHGFKFSNVIGKILCEMVLDEPLSFNIDLFRLNRKYAV